MIRELLATESETDHPSLQKSLRRRSARQAGEIDSYPDWQDLSPDLVNLAQKAGCRISTGTDVTGGRSWRSRNRPGFGDLAGVKRDRILNFLTRDEWLAWVAGVQSAHGVHIHRNAGK